MTDSSVLMPFKTLEHDHRRCVKSAIVDAENACKKNGLRLTAIRRQVLELVWSSHSPIKAYDILDNLHKKIPKAAPPTVYRALEFLQLAGLIHRIESLNAYIGCGNPDEPHSGQFLICNKCGAAAELNEPQIIRLISSHAKQLGFKTVEPLVEIRGLCPKCQ